MNENIRKLAELAVRDETDSHYINMYNDKFVENFAKLLIIEYRTQMIDTVQKFKDAPWEDNVYPAEPMVVNLSWFVQNHFGVEG